MKVKAPFTMRQEWNPFTKAWTGRFFLNALRRNRYRTIDMLTPSKRTGQLYYEGRDLDKPSWWRAIPTYERAQHVAGGEATISIKGMGEDEMHVVYAVFVVTPLKHGRQTMYNGSISQCEEDLEGMVDKFSTSSIICILSCIASEKAEHVRSNWQDERLAKQWDRLARVLERAYTHVKDVQS